MQVANLILKSLIAIISGLLVVVGYFLTTTLGDFRTGFETLNKQVGNMSRIVAIISTEFKAHEKEDDVIQGQIKETMADHEKRLRGLELPRQ